MDAIDPSENKKAVIEQKLTELIKALESTPLNSDEAGIYKERVNEAIQKCTVTKESLEQYRHLDEEGLSRMDMLDELSRLLVNTQIDNKTVKELKRGEWLSRIVTFAIGITLIALGFSMIILPAPASFEIYTLFYLTADDGVTIMDVISLLIVLTGVYVAITAMKKKTE